MPLFARTKSLIGNLFHRDRADRNIDEELRSYLDLLTEEKIATGLSSIEARRQAQIELGGIEQVKENVRDVRAGACERFAAGISKSGTSDVPIALKRPPRRNGR